MYALPLFVREVVHTAICDNCNRIYRDEDVIGFGIESIGPMPSICVTVRCRSCYRSMSLTAPTGTDLRDYLAELADMVGLRIEGSAARRRLSPEALSNRHSTRRWLNTDGEAWTDLPRKRIRLVSNLSPTGVRIKIKSHLPGGKTGTFDVLGGYKGEVGTVILYRCTARHVVPSDHLALLGSDYTLATAGFEEYAIDIPDWPRFEKLPDGAEFKLNGRHWRKLKSTQLKRSVAGLWCIEAVPPRETE
jgi:hypothetical protein